MDSLPIHIINRTMQRGLGQSVWGSYGVIKHYDANTHSARAVLQPSGVTTPLLPVLVSVLGLGPRILPETPCWVNCDRGVPVCIAGVAYYDASPNPNIALSLHGDAYITGNLEVMGQVEGHVPRLTSLPTPQRDDRGRLRLLAPTRDNLSGTADTLWVALQAADGTLAWHQVTTT